MTRVRLALALAAGLALCLIPGLAGANSVPSTRAGVQAQGIGPAAVAPAACAGLGVTAIVVGATGSDPGELLLGSAAGETMRGDKGDDCVVGGGGNDSLRGDQGTDVCIGGPGNDTFHASCETQIQ